MTKSAALLVPVLCFAARAADVDPPPTVITWASDPFY